MKSVTKIIRLSILFMTLACNAFIPKPSGEVSDCIKPPLGLVSWWRGEGNTTDTAGHYDGMFISNSVFASGKVGQAFSFNGIDNLVVVPDSDEWTPGVKDFTLDMWVNFNDIQSRTAFIGHDEGGGSTNKWIFWYDEFGDDGSPGPALRFHINPSTGLRNPIFATWTPTIGQWYHIAITRNTSRMQYTLMASKWQLRYIQTRLPMLPLH